MRIDSFSGKKCLITGAASGIGKALALAAAGEGAELFLTDINAGGLDGVVAQLRESGGKVCAAMAVDLADFAAVQAFANGIHAQHGSLDLVMNVAGIAVWGAIENLEHRQWRRVIDVNLMGPIHVLECFVPPMIAARRGGHVVNVSSAAGLFGLPWHAAYSASKFGLRGVSEVLRFDLRRHDIGVHLVCPGAVDTGLVKTVEIAGVDSSSPRLARFAARFSRHAATPEQAAQRILAGIERNRFWVYTSNDIRVAHFLQRRFETGYTLVMRGVNRRFAAIAEKL